MNQGYVLGMSRIDVHTVNRDNSLNTSMDTFRLEVRRKVILDCNGDSSKSAKLSYRSANGCFVHGTTVASSVIKIKRVKALDASGTSNPQASAEYGMFFENRLIGLLGEFVCRDTEVGKRFQEYSSDGKTALSKTHVVAGCTLPQFVNGTIKQVITLK